MQRFSAREFAFLCLPVLLVGVVGWLWARKEPPAPILPLHLEFAVEKPTTLEAFGGADAVMVTRLKGQGAEKFAMGAFATDPFLELQTEDGTFVSWNRRGYSGLWTQVWHSASSRDNRVRLPISEAAIPEGQLYFGFNTAPPPGATVPASEMLPPLAGKWPVKRSDIAPFEFNTLPRTPWGELRSIKITGVGATVAGECVFALTGAQMNRQTPVALQLGGSAKDLKFGRGGSVSSVSYGYQPQGEATPKGELRRVCNWSLSKPTGKTPNVVGRLSGRVSASENWPLGFAVAPFHFNNAKVGQNLSFKQWPLAPPKL